MKIDRRIIALGAIGIVILVYFGAVIVSAFSQSPVREQVASHRNSDIPSAEFAAEEAVRRIARRWDVEELKRTIDSSVQNQFWFESLKTQIELFRDEMGPIAGVTGNATFKPRGDVDFYDYRGEMECLKGRASVRVLVSSSRSGWRIVGMEFTPKMDDPTDTSPESAGAKPAQSPSNSRKTDMM